MASSVVVTINPNFIQHMLALTADRFQLPPPVGTWLDLSAAAGVIGGDGVTATSLGHWQEKMKTGGRHEHDAIYDVFAMAQLLQALLAYAEDSGIETLDDLRRNQSAESWMRPY
jgi:DNA polymerase III alpha subunit (gram-positive type)